MNYIIFKCPNCGLVDLSKHTDEVDVCPIDGELIEKDDVIKSFKSDDEYWTVYHDITRKYGQLTYYAK